MIENYPSQKVQCCGQTTRSDCSTLVFMARSQNRLYCTLHVSYQTNKPANKQVCGETLDSGSEGSRVQVPAIREQLNEPSFPWSLAQMVRWPTRTEGTYWSQGLILVTCGHFSPLLSDRSLGRVSDRSLGRVSDRSLGRLSGVGVSPDTPVCSTDNSRSQRGPSRVKTSFPKEPNTKPVKKNANLT